MDSTAPKNPKDQNPQTPVNSIQPGQFVVAGETGPANTPHSSPFKKQTNPVDHQAVFNSSTSAPQNRASQSEYQTPQVTPGQNLQSEVPQQTTTQNTAATQYQEPQPSPGGLNLAQETNPLSEPMVPPPPENSQPDPTPFVPPGSPPAQTPQELPQDGSSNKLKILLIGFGVIVLLAIIGGLFCFFVFNKKTPKSAKTESSQSVQIDEPSPPAKRTTGGFADLPPTTESSASASSPITP